MFQEVKQYYDEYQQMKQKQRAEAEQEVTARKLFLYHLFPWQQSCLLIITMKQHTDCKHADNRSGFTVGVFKDSLRFKSSWAPSPDDVTICSGEKRPKVKKPKVEFPVYDPSSENLSFQGYDQTTSIEEIEDQMDNWLQDRRAPRKKV